MERLIIPAAVIVAIIIVRFVCWIFESEPYTHAEWEQQCEDDFKKYGAPPEDE